MNIERRIALAGPTCSKKTTLSNLLAEAIPQLSVLHFDAYDLWPSGSARLSEAKAAGTLPATWEHPDLFDRAQYQRDLERWSRNEPIVIYDRSREGIAKSGGVVLETIPANRYVLVEGVFPYVDEESRNFFDTRVFVDVPLTIMKEARMARPHGDEPWDTEAYVHGPMIAGTLQYVLPQRRYADYILDATRPTEELVAQLTAIVINPAAVEGLVYQYPH